MLSVQLMCEAARRWGGSPFMRPLLDDAQLQAAYCLDAPNEVQDGVEFWRDEFDPECCGVMPRDVQLRGES